MDNNYEKPRPAISAEIRRQVNLECGHCCAIKACNEHTYLEIHHIDQNRENNTLDNLILLCDKHHKMAHAGAIDRKSLREYKRRLISPSEPSIESLQSLLFQIFGQETAMQLMSTFPFSIAVVLHPLTVEELQPYVSNDWIVFQSTGSICQMGAGNRVGNHVEDQKRPYGLGNGFVLKLIYNLLG
jgi:hypothetical protein